MTFATAPAALARALAARGYTTPTSVQSAVLEAPGPDRDLLVSAQTGSGKTVAFGLAMGVTLLGAAPRPHPVPQGTTPSPAVPHAPDATHEGGTPEGGPASSAASSEDAGTADAVSGYAPVYEAPVSDDPPADVPAPEAPPVAVTGGGAERLPRAEAPLALVIAPTRELALQVCRELAWLYESTGARVITCVGGMDPRVEARELAAGAHIVVGTPGRLRDHVERRRLDLSALRVAVLDEADEMLDLGFREDLEFLLDRTPAARRTLLFSATMPREIETLAGSYQRDAVRIETVRRNEPHADIEYRAHRVVPNEVEHAVVNVLRLHEARAAIVFCATREAVNRLSAQLIERGFSAVALSGELTQQERTRALQALRDGRARVLVATDVAARGLDLPDLALVVHAELPNDAETLLHRSGRTGRAGRKGLCVLVVPYNRRRKGEALIHAARITVKWEPTPTPEAIRALDQERFLADAAFAAPVGEDEMQAARALQAVKCADEIAVALLRLHGARMPAPEEISADRGPPREWRAREERSNFRSEGRRFERREHGGGEGGRFSRAEERGDRRPPWRRDETRGAWAERQGAAAATDNAGGEAGEPPREVRAPRPRRDDGRPMVWFRINIGRERNADPRWLLPLICNAGGVTKGEIGSIKIEERGSRFQIAAEVAETFEHAARMMKRKEGHIVRDTGDGDWPRAPRPHRDRHDARDAREARDASAEAAREPAAMVSAPPQAVMATAPPAVTTSEPAAVAPVAQAEPAPAPTAASFDASEQAGGAGECRDSDAQTASEPRARVSDVHHSDSEHRPRDRAVKPDRRDDGDRGAHRERGSKGFGKPHKSNAGTHVGAASGKPRHAGRGFDVRDPNSRPSDGVRRDKRREGGYSRDTGAGEGGAADKPRFGKDGDGKWPGSKSGGKYAGRSAGPRGDDRGGDRSGPRDGPWRGERRDGAWRGERRDDRSGSRAAQPDGERQGRAEGTHKPRDNKPRDKGHWQKRDAAGQGGWEPRRRPDAPRGASGEAGDGTRAASSPRQDRPEGGGKRPFSAPFRGGKAPFKGGKKKHRGAPRT